MPSDAERTEEALAIIERYKKQDPVFQNGAETYRFSDISERRIGLDNLEEYLKDHTYESISILTKIEDYIYRLNLRIACLEEGTEIHRMYQNMRDAADDVCGLFL